MNPKELQRILQQAQKVQEELAVAQEALAARTFEGSAGGAAVVAHMTGAGELTGVEIDPSVIDPDDAEMLGDLIVAAVNQAREEVGKATDEEIGGLAGGLGVPFG
ncbi:MAG: YbaB/EbfC family nucleoid-associated protein [Acidimicrobiia bacterium]